LEEKERALTAAAAIPQNHSSPTAKPAAGIVVVRRI